MSNPAIKVEGVGKMFRIGTGTTKRSYRTLRDTIADAAKAPFRALSRASKQATPHNTVWALEEVSFEVPAGAVVGLIGRNGAGKSTLLKVLSRITEPSRGRITIRGRVGSLMEVGTGFHPELTGYENIFLNGAILGMHREETRRKLDEIIAFAEVEKFIYTPVKHYSSGMYLRLAFSVAAHLEPEVLLVDEVLAVGDAKFQKKCLSRMQEVGKEGRTVLFVSHNMPAVTHLCPRTILLDQGRVLKDGPSFEVVGAYLNSGLGTTAKREWPDPEQAPGNDVVRLKSVRVHSDDGQTSESIDIRHPFQVEMVYEVRQPGWILSTQYKFFNEEGTCIFCSFDLDPEWRDKPRAVGVFRSVVRIPGNLLAEGSVFVTASIVTLKPMRIHIDEKDAVVFQVLDSLSGESARGDYAGRVPGVVRPLLPWTTRLMGGGLDDKAK